MGFIGGVVCFFGATSIKHMFGYDDSLDAFGVHGLGGTLGALLTGVFATAAINPLIRSETDAILRACSTGNARQILNQLLATLVTWVIAIVGSFVLLKIVDAVCGLRVSESDEYDGLDLTQHGESGYNLEDAFSATFAGGGATLIDEGRPDVASHERTLPA